MLRQFAGLSLVVFGGLAAWRLWHGQIDLWTYVLGAVAVLIGVTGLIAPAMVRPVFTGWMIVAFPIGWIVSHVALGLMFFLIFMPVAVVFRMTGRDALRLKRKMDGSYWLAKPASRSGDEYLRQF
jgi:Saxitoxin biosynthesis operon protein SxtJ